PIEPGMDEERYGKMLRDIRKSRAEHGRVQVPSLALTRAGVAHELHLVERFARTLRDRRVPVVLLEGPVNPRFAAMKRDFDRAYREELDGVLARTGATYWDVSDEAKLEADDFYDPIHMGNQAARARFEAALEDKIAARLRTLPRP
ncbi:MAG TPA: hypothetical protein VHB21_19590, partial [Minicystis sp.]|nr:hypothetical protein [Minicystis sp.]